MHRLQHLFTTGIDAWSPAYGMVDPAILLVLAVCDYCVRWPASCS